MQEKKAFFGVQIVLLVIIAVVIAFSMIGIEALWDKTDQAQPERIKEAIEKACIQCYALEGSYPPDLDYLKENYGVLLDHNQYFYYYEIFASNMMSVVEVYEKGS